MNVSRIGCIQGKLLAGTIAIVVAGVALVLALSNFRIQTPFHTAQIFVNALDQTKITSPVRLSDALVLEAGSIIQSQKVTERNGKASNDTQKLLPHLHLKNATLTLVEAAATQDRTSTTKRAVDSKIPTPSLIAALRTLGFRALHLDNTVVQLKRPGGSLQRVGQLTGIFAPSVDQTRLSAEGMFVRAGKTLRFTAQISPDPKDTGFKAVKLDIVGVNLKLALEGRLITAGGARITSEAAKFETDNLKHILEWLGMGPLTSGGFSKFSATGNLNWTGSTVAFEQSQFNIDGNLANGRLWFFFDPREPSVEGTLAFQKLELTPYLGASDQPSATSALKNAWTAIYSTASSGTLPLGFKEIDADIRLSAKSLEYGATTIGSGAAVVLVKDGKLKADIADMTLASGAKGRSQIEIDTTGPVPGYTLHGNVNGFDLGSTSSFWFGKPVVDGIADMTFDLAAKGRSKEQLLATLSGPIVVSAQKGASIPIDLVKLFAKAKTAPTDGWEHVENGFTALKDLSVELMSSKGALKTQSVKASIDGNALIATGTLKLTDLVLDLVLTKLAATEDGASHDNATSDNPGGQPSHTDALEFKGPITEPIIRLVPDLRKG